MAAFAILADYPPIQRADRPPPSLETAPEPPAHQTQESGSGGTSGSVVYIASFAGTLGLFFLVGCLLLIRAHRRSRRLALDRQLARQADGWGGLPHDVARTARLADDWRFVPGHGKVPIPKLYESRIDPSGHEKNVKVSGICNSSWCVEKVVSQP